MLPSNDHDYHVVSFAESHLIRERKSNVESFLAREERRLFLAAASPSSKSMKGSHGGVLVAPRRSLQPGAMVANVDNNKVERRGHDWAACVVKAVRACLPLCHGANDVNGRCPVAQKMWPSSARSVVLLLKQKSEFVIAG